MDAVPHSPHTVTPWDDPSHSSAHISILSGPAVTLWAIGPLTATTTEAKLQLAPDRSIVIGRQEGGVIEYLDPAYSPTRMLPETSQPILRMRGYAEDGSVSRGHFMLRGYAGGILFINGVPRSGGGIHPPLNGTWLLQPMNRLLFPAEEYLIEQGAMIVICLPNRSEIRIAARSE